MSDSDSIDPATLSDVKLDQTPRAWKLSKREAIGLILITLFIALRSWSIAHEHSATWDTIYHLDRAMLFVDGALKPDKQLNDPPMGEAIIYLPYLIERWFDPLPPLDRSLHFVAIWKSLLMLPALACALLWARNLYGNVAGWLVVSLIAFEPTLAAMTAYSTLDSLAIAAILPAAYVGFLYGQRPTWRRLIALAITTALTLVCKHTAIVLLPIGAMQMILAFVTRRRRRERFPIGAHLIAGCAIGLLSLWTLTGFDFSPATRIIPDHQRLPGFRLTTASIPAGVYFRSFSDATLHAAAGHGGFLWGQVNDQGWWYYYFVVACYKVPLGILLLSIGAIFSRRFSRNETGLIIPIACYTAFCITSTVAIGFRHALPLEMFCLIGIGRIMTRGKIIRLITWIILSVTIINVMWWNPNYLSFINAPREHVWMKISDSNLDWGQGLKQVGDWIKQKRAAGEDRQISLIYFGPAPFIDGVANLPRHIPPDIHIGMPEQWNGLLITTPIAVSGQYESPVLPAGFRSLQPREIIGNSMLVFDLDDVEVQEAINQSATQ